MYDGSIPSAVPYQNTHTMNGEMKVSDVRNWVLRNHPSEVWFTDMLWKQYSMGWTNRTLEGAWIETWAVEKLFKCFLADGEDKFKAMESDVATYFKDNPTIEPSIF